jgi:hypothetical protein
MEPRVAPDSRHLAHGLVEVLAASPLFLFAPLYRNRHLRWGATEAEVAEAMPGDELVPEPSFSATRAITIDAPPEAVWPWIVQIGYGRAGWYSYDLFDNAARPSAAQILPEHQHPQLGDWIPMSARVDQTTAFKIAGLVPNEWMLWEKPQSTWAWRLTPLDAQRTRLVVRLKAMYEWKSFGSALLTLILLEFGDFPMMRKLLLGLRQRAERMARESGSATAS